MTQLEINKLKETIAEAEKQLIEGPLKALLAKYIDQFAGKVILYKHSSATVKSLYFIYYKEFYLYYDNYDKKNIVKYKGEKLEIGINTYRDCILLNKKEDTKAPDLYDVFRENDPSFIMLSIEEYKRYRNAVPGAIKILHTDILGNEGIIENEQ